MNLIKIYAQLQYGLGSLKGLLRLGSYCCFGGTVALWGGGAFQENPVTEAKLTNASHGLLEV